MITYTDDLAGVQPEQLAGFFEGWPNPPSPEAHLRILSGSSHVVLATASDGQVVGFVTAISDGVLTAYVPLLEVLPSHRRQGIGTELIRRLLAQTRWPLLHQPALRSRASAVLRVVRYASPGWHGDSQLFGTSPGTRPNAALQLTGPRLLEPSGRVWQGGSVVLSKGSAGGS